MDGTFNSTRDRLEDRIVDLEKQVDFLQSIASRKGCNGKQEQGSVRAKNRAAGTTN